MGVEPAAPSIVTGYTAEDVPFVSTNLPLEVLSGNPSVHLRTKEPLCGHMGLKLPGRAYLDLAHANAWIVGPNSRPKEAIVVIYHFGLVVTFGPTNSREQPRREAICLSRAYE